MELFGISFSGKTKSSESLFSLLGEGLKDLLPKAIQRKLTVGEEYLDIILESEQVKVMQHSGGIELKLEEMSYIPGKIEKSLVETVSANLDKDSEVWLSLSEDEALSKKIFMPKAVENNLTQVVGYELNKHTPFSAKDVYYDVVKLSEKEGQLSVLLSIVPRKQLDAIISDFKQAGVRFDRVQASEKGIHLTKEDIEQRAHTNLLPSSERRKKRGMGLPFVWVYALIILFLVGSTTAVPMLLKRNTAIQLNEQLHALAPRATGERDLWVSRDDKLELIESYNENLTIPLSVIIEDLSRRLDDTTYVTELQYHSPKKLLLRGKSKRASSLINMLSESNFINNVSFKSPIITLGNGEEGFHVLVELKSPNDALENEE